MDFESRLTKVSKLLVLFRTPCKAATQIVLCGNSICFAAGSFQNPLADTTAVSTTASSSQNPLTGSDFTCSACEPSNTGLYEDTFEKPSRKRAKIYCDHCEEYVSKSSWYEHYNKFYSPSTKMWKKETRSKPLGFNFDEEQFSSDECPVMEESSDQIYPELNSSSTDAVDEMHPNSQVSSYMYSSWCRWLC